MKKRVNGQTETQGEKDGNKGGSEERQKPPRPPIERYFSQIQDDKKQNNDIEAVQEE
ncbi:hypothetical protein M1413_01015 [Patescibacteria group bacterium]|nr:hypothetical protein [Patescibacteria group bacterium]MCL5114334.1 hypothetical protein [Patescibacteria group bacterium]